METKAQAKYLHISPRKAHLVAREVCGKKVEEAVNLLTFTPKKGGRLLLKVLKSAIANASHNAHLDIDSLYIKKIAVNAGPTLKRFMPRAMGRATRVLKRTAHITVILDES
jgi:large subunit ribosomal protein L22